MTQIEKGRKTKNRYRDLVSQMTFVELLFEFVRLYLRKRRKKA